MTSAERFPIAEECVAEVKGAMDHCFQQASLGRTSESLPFAAWEMQELPVGTALVNKVTDQRYDYTFPNSMVHGVPHPGFIRQDVWDLQKANLKFREGDVFICTMSKCGTTFMEQIVALLQNGGRPDELDPLSKNTLDPKEPNRVGKIWVEMAVTSGLGEQMKAEEGGQSALSKACMGEGKANMSAQDFDMLPGPRIIKTHAPRHLFLATGPNGEGLAPGVKVIYVTRNPLDACVSLYHHPKPGVSPATTGCPFDGFARLYLSDRVEFGGWVDHVWPWREEALRSPEQVLWVTYEDMFKRPFEIVKQIAAFLAVEADDELVRRVVEGSAFDSVKARARQQLDSGTEGNLSHLRKGGVGGWAEYFTDELRRDFEAELQSQLQGRLDATYDVGGHLLQLGSETWMAS